MNLSEFPNITQIRAVIQQHCVRNMGAENIPPDWDLDSIAGAVHKYCKQHQVDPVLALAQGILESHFAVNPQARRSRDNKNIFNWLNTDDGKNHAFPTYEAGIEQYCRTMRKEYYWKDDPDKGAVGWVSLEMMIRHDFMRPIGGRYATAWDYTITIEKLAKSIKKTIKGARQ